MAELSLNEQRKLAYFHALGKVMTESTQNVYESKYKSSHNVRLKEVWSDDIGYAVNFAAAELESLSNSAVTLCSGVTLTEIPGSNGQTYYYNSGGTFVRPWISPVDVPHITTNDPSDGYQVKLYRGNGSEIYLTDGVWTVDYYAGIIHFGVGSTPIDLSWGAIKSTFFMYSGNYGASGGTSTDALTSVIFNSGTSTLVFNSGETTETIVDLSSLKNVSGTTSLISTLNTNMTALNTSSGSTLACGQPLGSNISGSKVSVFINGVQVNVGDLSTDDCYFSIDGITKKSSGSEVAGDSLYWNYVGGIPVSGYELTPIDRITFLNLKL